MITSEQAKQLLSQDQLSSNNKPTITPEQAKRLLAQADEEETKQPLHDLIFQGLRPQSISDIPGELSNLGRGVLGGTLTLGRNLGEAQAKIVRPILNDQSPLLKELGIPYAQSMQKSLGSNSVTGIDKILSPEVIQSSEGKVGEFIGETAPLFGIPSGEAIKVGGKIIPWLSREAFKKSGAEVSKQAGILGAVSPIYQPDTGILQAEKNAFSDPLAYAALGASPVLSGISKSASALKRMYNLKGGTASPEEVLKRISAAGKTPVPLGELIDSPTLKGMQSSVLAYTPGSGMAREYMKAGESLNNRTNSVLDSLNKKPGNDFGGNIGQNLKDLRVQARDRNQVLHDEFAATADQSGAKVEPKEYIQTAKTKLDEMKKNSNSNQELSAIESKSQRQIKELLSNIAEGIPKKAGANSEGLLGSAQRPITASDFKNAKVVGGRLVINPLKQESSESRIPLQPKDFGSASLLRASLNTAIDDAEKEGNAYHIGILSSLKDSLEKDIEESAKKSGNKDLHDQYLEAKRDYAENVAPFEQGEIGKFAKPTSKADTDMILQTFIRTGKTERPTLLKKLTRNLDDDSISQMAHEYLTQRGRGDLDKTLTAYNQLGDKVKDILFKPEEKKELDNILLTRKSLGKDIHQMMSNPTGEKAAKAAGYGALPTALGSILTGHPAGAAVVGGGMLSANLLKRALMGNNWREQYLKASVKNPAALKLSNLPLKAYIASQNQGGG